MVLDMCYPTRRLYQLSILYAFVFIISVEVVLAAVAQPSGYRMQHYRAQVPDALEGANTITATGVKRLQQTSNAVVIDVLPQQRRPAALSQNQIWIPLPHKGIPGAIWLPDVGYGALSEVTETYFKHHLQLATKGDRNHPVVIYCRANCWMSWNAAKRALSYGYSDVYWFSEGIEDWLSEGFDVEVMTPAAGQRHIEVTDD